MVMEDSVNFLIKSRDLSSSLDISVVIPAKNEEQRIPQTLQSLYATLDCLQVSYEVIVVNDGSVDHTANVAESFGAHVICHPQSMGIAAAFRSGAKVSLGKVVMLCPADIEDFEFLNEAIPDSQRFDVVSISKRHPESIVLGYNRWRWLLSNGYQRIVRFMFGPVGTCTDTHYIKLYNGVILRGILGKCSINGPVGETEIMLLARDAGCSFFEIPAKILHNGHHSKTSILLVFRTMKELIRLRVKRMWMNLRISVKLVVEP
jgi:glycosyltransferase involved in cell wall biosynthesis